MTMPTPDPRAMSETLTPNEAVIACAIFAASWWSPHSAISWDAAIARAQLVTRGRSDNARAPGRDAPPEILRALAGGREGAGIPAFEGAETMRIRHLDYQAKIAALEAQLSQERELRGKAEAILQKGHTPETDQGCGCTMLPLDVLAESVMCDLRRAIEQKDAAERALAEANTEVEKRATIIRDLVDEREAMRRTIATRDAAITAQDLQVMDLNTRRRECEEECKMLRAGTVKA